jgi:hypothetical protein
VDARHPHLHPVLHVVVNQWNRHAGLVAAIKAETPDGPWAAVT